MENDEGCAPPTADVADFEVAAWENNMPAACGGNRMPKIPTQRMRSRSFAQRRATRMSGSCRPCIPHTPTR